MTKAERDAETPAAARQRLFEAVQTAQGVGFVSDAEDCETWEDLERYAENAARWSLVAANICRGFERYARNKREKENS